MLVHAHSVSTLVLILTLLEELDILKGWVVGMSTCGKNTYKRYHEQLCGHPNPEPGENCSLVNARNTDICMTAVIVVDNPFLR